jgi:hypothetical protein
MFNFTNLLLNLLTIKNIDILNYTVRIQIPKSQLAVL